MARGINKVIVVGNMVADPDVRYNQGGSAMMLSRIATSEQWKDKNTGEKRENTEYVNLVAYGKVAEIFGEYVHKGDRMYIEGKLQTRKYEKDGVEKYVTQVVVMSMLMLNSKNSEGPRTTQPPRDYPPQDDAPPMGGDFDDDIPF